MYRVIGPGGGAWIRQDEADRGERGDRPITSELEGLRRLRKENAEIKRANEILKVAARFWSMNSTGPGDGDDAGRPAA